MARSSPRMSLPASLAGSPTEVSATVADGPPTASYIQMPEGSPEATPPPIPVTVPLVRPPAYSTTGGSRVTPTGFPLLTTPTSHTRTHLTIVFNFPHASKKPLKKSEAKKTTKPPRYTIVEPFYCTRTGLLQFINWNGSADEHQLCVNILSQCEVIDELYIGAPLTEDFKDAEFHELQRALGRVNTVRFSDIIRPTFTYPALQKVVGFFDIPRGPYVQLDDRRPEAHRDLLMSPLPPSVQYVCFVVTHAKGHTTAKHTVNATALKHCIGLQRVVLILDVADDAEGSKIHPRGTPKSGIGPFTPFIRSCAHLMPRTRLDLYGLEMWQPEWLYPPNEFPSGLEDQRAFIFFALMKLVHVVRREQGALGSFEDVRRAVNALKDPNNEAVLSIVSVMRLLSRASIEDQITSPSIVSGPSTLRHLYDGVEDNSPPPPPPNLIRE
ncbi:hypothetical protein Q8F55_009251 [Vanrija albida]|uniref:Uncharacterized protein n=1 Tax=Vanrija albida TaxID=181172 RepID=A0ABR3PT42_9TREE